MNNYTINILHLYPDLLNLYGDKGNIECLRKRLMWRNIDVIVNVCNVNDTPDIKGADIIFLGGGADRETELVMEKLADYRCELIEYVEKGGVLLALCSGFPLVGKSISVDGKKTEALGIVDMITETDSKAKRLTGNIILECENIENKVIGFENHISRTFIGDNKPLGKVLRGFGSDGEGTSEGIIYKNLIGTYLHGPLLPKNPQLCDLILLNAIKLKYPDFSELSLLDDSLETNANKFMEKRI